jgi:hypothetical protein
VKSRIQIRIRVISRIRIGINVMRIHNTSISPRNGDHTSLACLAWGRVK